MPECEICGGPIPTGSRTCTVCGSSADEFFPAGTELKHDNPGPSAVAMPTTIPTGGSYCPSCAQIFGPDYADTYCTCGTELCKALADPSIVSDLPMAPVLDEEMPMAPVLDDEPALAPLPAPAAASKSPIVKPASGTPCLVLYGPDKQPLRYFALEKDAVLIGRLDAVAGNFPDIDLDEWFDRSTIRKVSRQHALILRSRASSTFVLRPLTGNTGTQLETQLLEAMQDYPLRPGHRIVLGGVIRLKFEVA